MRPPSNLEPPDPTVWAFVQDLVTRFETACQQEGDVVPLEQFLPPAGNPLRLSALLELIKSDLAVRWRRAKGITLEEYLTRFPELLGRPSQWPQLLYEEFGVRHAYGDRPALADYQQRFPEQFGLLEKLVGEVVGANIKHERRPWSALSPAPVPETAPQGKPMPTAPRNSVAGAEARKPSSLSTATAPPRDRLRLVPAFLFIALACVPVGWLVYEMLRPTPVPTVGREPSYRLEAPGQVSVRAGESVPFTIQVDRHDFTAPIRVTFSGLPDGVTLREQTVPGDQRVIQAMMKTDCATPPGTHKVILHGNGADHIQQAAFTLQVLPSEVVFRPDLGWARVPQATVKADAPGRLFCDKIDVVREGKRFRFLLIPRRQGEMKDIATYYIMENKVSVAQFRLFTTTNPEKVKSKRWQEAGDVGGGYPKDDFPVFNVPVEDAYHFARWLNGNLPTIDQWDKAAGRFEVPRSEGPYRGHWDDQHPLDIAVARGPDMGPRKCGEAKDDVSPFGCHDMAGNGYDWTRNLDTPGKTVPLTNPDPLLDNVILRGRTFLARLPLQFDYLEKDERDNTQPIRLYQEPRRDLGFRVVIEP